jgi:hypothetical protein
VKEIEDHHLNDFSTHKGVTEDFNALLSQFVRKPFKHSAGVDDVSTMHPVQREIIQTNWAYDGWEQDITEIRDNCCIVLFNYYHEKCKLKQMIHDNDLSSHPALIELHELRLSYPGWKRDIKEAKAHLCEIGYATDKKAFHDKINAIKNKQRMYSGNQDDNCCICLNEMSSTNDGTVRTLNCGHKLHFSCFDEVIQSVGVSRAKCPLCRASLRYHVNMC